LFILLKNIFFTLFLFSSLIARDSFTFAPLPMEDRQSIYSDFYPMIKYLEKKLGVTIEFVYYDSYDDIIKNFKENKIDLAYLGPLPYVALKNTSSQATPIVTFKNEQGESSYTCSLVTSIHTKEKKKVALTQALSTCGYLSVNALLDKKLENYEYRYLGRHDLVALSILQGKFDLGGVKTSIANQFYHLGLEEVYRTKPFPTFALVANASQISQEMIQNIQNALIYIDQQELDTWGESIKYGANKMEDSLYEHIRAMKKNVQISQKDNF
jgi:phosphonate transport system substrate-binding protein